MSHRRTRKPRRTQVVLGLVALYREAKEHPRRAFGGRCTVEPGSQNPRQAVGGPGCRGGCRGSIEPRSQGATQASRQRSWMSWRMSWLHRTRKPRRATQASRRRPCVSVALTAAPGCQGKPRAQPLVVWGSQGEPPPHRVLGAAFGDPGCRCPRCSTGTPRRVPGAAPSVFASCLISLGAGLEPLQGGRGTALGGRRS